MRRVCDKPPGGTCLSSRVTLPGAYTLEVCAYTAIGGDKSAVQGTNGLFRGSPAGQKACRRVAFRLPAVAPVIVRFGSRTGK